MVGFTTYLNIIYNGRALLETDLKNAGTGNPTPTST